MFKGLTPITYAGREVWPLVEGGKGVAATNHASAGAWAAAGGIGFINAFGNIGGAVGPAVVGWIKDVTGSYSGGLYGLAAFTAVSAVIAAFGLHIPRRVGAATVAPAE